MTTSNALTALEITYKKIDNPIDPNSGLQKCQVHFNGQPIEIWVEKVYYGYRVRGMGQDLNVFFNKRIEDVSERHETARYQAQLYVKGLVFDMLDQRVRMEALKAQQEQATTEPAPEQETIEYRFFRGKYRAYRVNNTKAFMHFENWKHLQNWARKHSEYRFSNPDVYATEAPVINAR